MTVTSATGPTLRSSSIRPRSALVVAEELLILLAALGGAERTEVDVSAIDDDLGLTARTVETVAGDASGARYGITHEGGQYKHGPATLLPPIPEPITAPSSWADKR